MLPLQRTSHSWAQPPGAGVSLWLDGLSRQRLQSGSLKDLIATRGVVGVTTNPATFRAAMQDGCAYRQRIRELAARGADLDAIVRQLTIDDVRDASDLFSAVYSRTRGVDGRVCLPVDPRLADDTDGTIEAAWTSSRSSSGTTY